jgi:isoamylase
VSDVWPGRPFPLGATWDGSGTNFSLFSENAHRVELCLFDDDGRERRVELRERTAFNWHCYLPGTGPGQRYGYRVHGPYEPLAGHRFNAAKLLIDPYAKAIEGPVEWERGNTLPYVPDGADDADLEPDDEDDADAIPKGIVVDPGFDWEGDRLLERPWDETVIYETHVKGFTMRHPDVREDLRGTYAGLASEAAIEYLTSLGVTAVELLPVHHIADEQFLADKGLTNYWGYSSIGYLAPHALYAATGRRGEQVREFKGMVKALHRAGIEVILDVVYNHTAEGNHLGPMLSFKGVDNASYYRLMPDEPRFYMDFTGTGNSLNPVHPSVLRLIMDSLRYFVLECHVDGFRFDLASALAREFYDVDRLSAFFDTIHQDPVLSQVKLIAEPWDVGPGGYQVGNFPVLWTEWNGIYRDTMRDFWRGRAPVADFAQRFTGSADLYQSDGRSPFASINFVTAHDGFTLRDLVSYDEKHNEANLEGGRDGTDDNRSWNHGVEGPTDDPEIAELRRRQQRNFLVTLLLSQGVPMLLGGDELARTQRGNNNAWCQDNELSWYDWELGEEERALHAFARRLIAFRAEHPVFRRPRFFQGRDVDGSGVPDVWWFRLDGRRMTQRDWRQDGTRTLGVFLDGRGLGTVSPRGEALEDDTFLLLFNASHEPVVFTLPPRRFGRRWRTAISTAEPDVEPALFPARGLVPLEARSVVVLQAVA